MLYACRNCSFHSSYFMDCPSWMVLVWYLELGIAEYCIVVRCDALDLRVFDFEGVEVFVEVFIPQFGIVDSVLDEFWYWVIFFNILF